MERNVAYTKSLNLPPVTRGASQRLAVIGGGTSLRTRLDELREFTGDKWIIGTAYQFCRSNGIDGAFFNIDPQPADPGMVEGAKKAVLASCVDASVFDALLKSGADVQVFDLVRTPESTNHGPSTATAAPELAVTAGYLEIAFYGCEGSYPGKTEGDADLMRVVPEPMRAYPAVDSGRAYQMRVECNGEAFLTIPEFLMQCECLSGMMRLFPPLFKERSGGLLGAMVNDPNYNITHGTRALHDICVFN